MRLDLTDLQLFVSAVDCATIAAAGAAVHLSPAAAGERLRALESRLGVALLERGPRGVAATPAGMALLAHARDVLGQVDALRGELESHRDGLRGRVRLLGNTAACREALPARLAGFLRGRPEVGVDLDERGSEAIVEAIRAGRADLGIVSDAIAARGLWLRALRPDPLVLVMPPAHPLAGRGPVRLVDVLDEPFVGLPADSALQSHIDAQARRHGRFLGYRLRVNGLDELCRLAGLGLGMAIVPRTVAARCARRSGARAVGLSDGWARRRLMLAARSFDDLAPAARALVGHLSPGLAAEA